jgi:GxxExxY protein
MKREISFLHLFVPIFLTSKLMPIASPVVIRPIKQAEFARIDYQVMRHAFDSQNELGRLCDEVIYQNDLAARLRAAGFGQVRTEVPVTVMFRDFAKTYFLDLVVEDAAICELKTATALIGEHDAQLLNYLFLRGAHHGKLINFRSTQVESKFVNTQLTLEARKRLEFDTKRWREPQESSQFLRLTLVALFEDLGGFLDLALYTEALTHLLGGEERVVQMVPLARNGVPLGNQRFHLLAPDTAFRFTALREEAESYEHQLRSLLCLTGLRTMQWINLAHHKIQFVTLTR